MEVETIRVQMQDGSEAVINKTDFDPDLHKMPGDGKPAPKRRGRPKKGTEAE